MANWRNYVAAINSGISAFKFALTNPGDAVVNDVYSARLEQYRLGWSAYSNEVFSALNAWGTHATSAGLYAKTKGFYNPTTRLCDFNVGHVFQGVLTDDGARLPDGEMLAIPLSKDTPKEVRIAIAQLWQWGNWQQGMNLWVLFGASMGDSFVEGLEDVDSGRVWPEVVPPAFITDFELKRKNVVSYTKEFQYYDRADKRSYTYKKTVTKERIETFRDGEPFGYDGNESSYDNPFGFVPLVYNPHRDLGSVPGAPAIRCWNKIEHLNSLATRLYRFIEIQSQSPQLLLGDVEVDPLTFDATKGTDSDIKLLRMKGQGSVHTLSGNLDLAATEKRLESLIAEIEHDHPEVVMYDKLRSMGEVSGVAVERLMGDVRGHVQRARAGYDSATIRIFQMLLSMGGMRANERRGGWRNLTDQQKKFLPFDLASYERGLMDFSIDPRPLVPVTAMETAAIETARYGAIKAGIDAGEPLFYQLEQKGAEKKDINRLKKAQQDADLMSFNTGFGAPPADTEEVSSDANPQ